MKPPIRLGIAGLGTVGRGVIKILERNSEMIAKRIGRQIEIAGICARSKKKSDDINFEKYHWEDDPHKLACRNDIDIFVELMGGIEGVAKNTIEAALENGKNVVTANKALLAIHGNAFAQKATKQGCTLAYEAAVAGAIPIVKTLTEALAANRISRIFGVMNGTCNYILTRMETQKLSYAQAFEEANALGYLEADPSLDVDGIDTAHKLAILSTLCFGTKIDFGSITYEGIRKITREDITYALNLGFRIKLLGVAQCDKDSIEQRVSPCLVPKNSALGLLENATNMIIADCNEAGQITLCGAGAGSEPTASAVMGDIIDIACGRKRPIFGIPTDNLIQNKKTSHNACNAYYLRMFLKDQPGSLSKVAGILSNHNISIDRMRQPQHKTDMACVVIITHKINHHNLQEAQKEISKLDIIDGETIAMRIEKI